MVFAGLPVGVLLGVGGAAAALTVLFYVLKLRRRPVAVPFSPIWQKVLLDRDASRWFSRLRRLLSLLLQLCLLALLVLALGDPRPTAARDEARHVVVLVDASASMKATDVLPTRLDAARARVRALVDGLGSADRMLVAEMGATITPLSTMTGDAAELGEAVARITATDTRADLGRGLDFALDTLRGLPRPEIVVVGDGGHEPPALAPQLGDVAISFAPVGERGDNLAITALSARRYPLDKSRYEVLLEVTNAGGRDEEVEVTLLGDGDVVDVSRFKVGAGESLHRAYTDLGGASRRLEATMRLADGRRDALPADDHAYATMPERRRARVLVVTAGNTYLEAALLLDEYLDVTTVGPGDYPPAGEFDVTVFDGVAPPRAARTGAALYLGPPAGGPVALGKSLRDFGFDTWDKQTPLLRWTAPENVQVARGHALEPGEGDRVVAASADGPILVEGRRPEGAFVALGFDPRDSDLVMRVAWPLFLLNVVDRFVGESTDYVSSYRTGEVWHVPVAPGLTEARLVGPGGVEHRAPVEDGRAVLFGTDAGFYRVLGADGAPIGPEIAANLSDVRESRVAPVRELALGGAPAPPPSGFEVGGRRVWWVWLLVGALALSFAEWFGYHRRVTV